MEFPMRITARYKHFANVNPNVVVIVQLVETVKIYPTEYYQETRKQSIPMYALKDRSMNLNNTIKE